MDDPESRRVEAFYFDSDLGVEPPPPGKTSKRGSAEYPEWVRRAKRTEDYYLGFMVAWFLDTVPVKPSESEAAPEVEIDEAKVEVQRAPRVAQV